MEIRPLSLRLPVKGASVAAAGPGYIQLEEHIDTLMALFLWQIPMLYAA